MNSTDAEHRITLSSGTLTDREKKRDEDNKGMVAALCLSLSP